MADVDTLLDLDGPTLSSQPPTDGPASPDTKTDPFDISAFDNFGGVSPVREGEPSVLIDDFDPFGPSTTTTSTKTDSMEVISMTSTHLPNRTDNFDDQFSELLGDFGRSVSDVSLSDNLQTSKQNGTLDKADDETNGWRQQQANFSDDNTRVYQSKHYLTTTNMSEPIRVGVETSHREASQSTEPSRGNRSRDRRQQPLGDENMCNQCGKRVYEMEKVTADEIVYHKACFRCTHCNRVLSLMNYSAVDGQVFCKPHFLEIFRTKGNYEDGFMAPKAGTRVNADNDRESNDIYGGSPSSPWRDSPYGQSSYSDSDEQYVVWQSDDTKEEIPTIPLKHVRNIFENLVQSSSEQQQAPLQQKRSAKLERPRETKSEVFEQVDGKQIANKHASSVESHRRMSDRDEDVGEKEVVQGTSTVYVIEDELPPPAFTRNILAKFRDLEAGESSKAAPSSGKPVSAPSLGGNKRVVSAKAGTTGRGRVQSEENRSPDRGHMRDGDGNEEYFYSAQRSTLRSTQQTRDSTKKKKVPTATLR